MKKLRMNFLKEVCFSKREINLCDFYLNVMNRKEKYFEKIEILSEFVKVHNSLFFL